MPQRSFVHLHCHTHYSLLDGASRVPELVQLTKSLGMNAISITDHGNLFGAIEFYKECTAAGINPIIGYEAYVSPGRRTEREAKRRGEAGYHLTLLAQNATGFKNLVKMSSIAYMEGYHYIPRIDKELLEHHKDGLICLSGCASSEFSEYILKEQMEEATELARWFHRLFDKNFYVEIQNNGLDIQKRCAEGAVEIANKLGLPLVATSDAHYLRQEDNIPHDVLLCINTGRTLKDENRMRYGSDQFYVRPPEEMYKLFPGHAEAVQRSQEIADGCDIQLDFKKRHFPVFTPPKGKKPEDYLRQLCEEGLQERYGPEASPEAQARLEEARRRLEHELGVISRMGFASYFLIVWDFVRFAISKNIPASARGSACGAIVSYVLKLSHVCPIEYDLLFERFLDPNRGEAPDIDIDFCQERREEVIQYVRERYGESSVAQIGTFGTLAAKAAIKDVGRVMDIPLDRVIRLTAMVPAVLNITLDEALEQSPDLRQEYENDPEIRKLIDIARKLEGTNRQAGTHAAGVVIANGPITDYVPVQKVMRKGYENGNRGPETVMTTQWVMGDLEKVGMLKMDFLGLRTLTVLDNTFRLIRKNRLPKTQPGGVSPRLADLEAIRDSDPRTYNLLKYDLKGLPLDDKPTYALLQKGDAKGVFQLESDGIRELLKRMKPDNIRDLIATNALYRPGPLGGGMVDAYVNRKHGREKPVYEHAVMEAVLEETYGVLIYQEQIMRVLNRLGGIELASAYACIKAISKKKQDIMDARKADFLKGSQEKGLEEGTATAIWDLIVQFAGYGFNKCVVAETVLIHAATGERTTVGELFKNRRPFLVHALGEDGKLRPRRVTDVMWNGRKPVYRLRTKLGKTIVATANHPFWTLKGWTNLGELKPGFQVATAQGIDRDVRNRNILWDTVVSIEPVGVEDTYDLTVEVDHNFVADGLIVHNSHSAAYALLGYQTAYLKTHYTPEFMAALLSSEIEDSNKRDLMVQHIEDARKLGVEVRPPDVQTCEPDFTVEGGKILFGLCAIKGLGRGAAEEILRARNEKGPFKDLFDFCERIDHKQVPKAAIEKMIKAGALDRLGGHRAQLLDALPRAMDSAGQAQQDRRHGQGNLFETFAEPAAAQEADGLRDIPPWVPSVLLKFEKEALDFYVSSHPLAQFQDTLDRFAPVKVKDLASLAPNQEVFMGGMLTQVRFMNTKKARNGNSRYVRCKLEDFTGAAECVMWPDDYVKFKDLIEEDRIVFVQGGVEKNRDEPGLILTRILTMEQGQKERTTGLVLLLSLKQHQPSQMEAVAQVLKRSQGSVPVFLHIQDAAGKWLKLKASDGYRINPATLAKEDLEVILGPGRVEFARQGAYNGNGR